MPRPMRRPSTPTLPEIAPPENAAGEIVFDTATVARTLDRLIAGRLQDLETLRAIAIKLNADGGNEAMHRQLLALARSAREAVEGLQQSRAILVGRHKQASGGQVVAAVDSGTGVANSAAFATHLAGVLKQLKPANTLSLMVIEIGALQLLANEAGPVVAGRVIRRFAAILRRTVKRSDYIARIAPDQFAVIFENILPENTVSIALRIHEAIEKKMLPSGESITGILSVNMGIAGTTGQAIVSQGATDHGTSAEDLLQMARNAVIQARREGRPAIFVA